MNTIRILGTVLAGISFTLLLHGCGSGPQVEESYEPATPVQRAFKPPSDGTIFRAGTEVRLFEDLKAGRVGDILTVRLVEKTNASKNSNTSTAKDTDVDYANPTLFGRQPTWDGTPLFDTSISGSSTFSGEGSSNQSNSLIGDITVTVTERLPNGNLRIRGEKWVTLNQGKEFIRLSGIIRPYDIEPDNSLFSNRIADAQITYSSKGVLADANRMGFLTRFFNSVFYPF